MIDKPYTHEISMIVEARSMTEVRRARVQDEPSANRIVERWQNNFKDYFDHRNGRYLIWKLSKGKDGLLSYLCEFRGVRVVINVMPAEQPKVEEMEGVNNDQA